MATKAMTANGDDPLKKGQTPKFFENAIGTWNDFTRFLSDVRSETRKVVAPSRKEVQATTTVVIVAVFVFGLFFFVVDAVCRVGIDHLFKQLGGLQ